MKVGCGLGWLFAAAVVVAVCGCGARDQEKDAGAPKCTLDMCRINDAGTRACCATEPTSSYPICCAGPTAQMAVCAYSPTTGRYIEFCDHCLPSGWKPTPSGTGTCP